MGYLQVFALLLVSATVAMAMPRYVAIPIEDLEAMGSVIQPVLQRRIARSYNEEPEGAETILVAEESSPDRQKRGGYHGSHVDYGSYTGGHGAFGWYTDHPVGRH